MADKAVGTIIAAIQDRMPAVMSTKKRPHRSQRLDKLKLLQLSNNLKKLRLPNDYQEFD